MYNTYTTMDIYESQEIILWHFTREWLEFYNGEFYRGGKKSKILKQNKFIQSHTQNVTSHGLIANFFLGVPLP